MCVSQKLQQLYHKPVVLFKNTVATSNFQGSWKRSSWTRLNGDRGGIQEESCLTPASSNCSAVIDELGKLPSDKQLLCFFTGITVAATDCSDFTGDLTFFLFFPPQKLTASVWLVMTLCLIGFERNCFTGCAELTSSMPAHSRLDLRLAVCFSAFTLMSLSRIRATNFRAIVTLSVTARPEDRVLVLIRLVSWDTHPCNVSLFALLGQLWITSDVIFWSHLLDMTSVDFAAKTKSKFSQVSPKSCCRKYADSSLRERNFLPSSL